MLKFFLIIVSIIGSSSTFACSFISDQNLCSDTKLNILDAAVDNLHLGVDYQNTLKEALNLICKKNKSCIHETLSYQLQKKGNTTNFINVVEDHRSVECVALYTLYPENSTVLFNQNKRNLTATINEDIVKDSNNKIYIKENRKISDASACNNDKSTLILRSIPSQK